MDFNKSLSKFWELKFVNTARASLLAKPLLFWESERVTSKSPAHYKLNLSRSSSKPQYNDLSLAMVNNQTHCYGSSYLYSDNGHYDRGQPCSHLSRI